MKIQYASDLHLEFKSNSDYIKKNPLIPSGDILVLAGDIDILDEKLSSKWFWEYCSENWEYTYWVPGNHEYYHGFPTEKTMNQYARKILDNVEIINNAFVEHKGIQIFFTTLWSILDPVNIPYILTLHNDFNYINFKGGKLTSIIYEAFHKKSLHYLEQWYDDSHASHRIVVSHFVPSELCNPEIYKGTNINSAFVVDLTKFIDYLDIDYWIYGHHHVNVPLQEIDETKLVTNQLGYIPFDQSEGFKRDAVITVGE